MNSSFPAKAVPSYVGELTFDILIVKLLSNCQMKRQKYPNLENINIWEASATAETEIMSAPEFTTKLQQIEEKWQRLSSQGAAAPPRQKIAQMSSEVVDSNPYRLETSHCDFFTITSFVPAV